MNRLRVLVADDHDNTRALVVSLLDEEFQLVGDVPDGEMLVHAALRLKPDVIVSDIMMPRLDGFSARGELASKGMHVPFVFITVMKIDELLQGAEPAGIAYVHKSDLPDELSPAIHAVHQSRSYVSRSFRRR
jgi:DNA-binding NarL/FixJ family response regulator